MYRANVMSSAKGPVEDTTSVIVEVVLEETLRSVQDMFDGVYIGLRRRTALEKF